MSPGCSFGDEVCHPLADQRCQSNNRWPLEKTLGGQIYAKHLFEPNHHLRRRQRVAAEFEEIVLDTDGPATKHVREGVGDFALGGRARRLMGCRLRRPTVDADELQRLGQIAAVQLPGRAEGDLVDHHNQSRHLELGKPAGDELADLPGQLVGFSGVRRQHNRRGDALAQRRIRDAEDHRLCDGRVLLQYTFDDAGRHLLAASVDDLFQPSGDKEVAVDVEITQVAGAEPAVRKRCGVPRDRFRTRA